MFGCALLLQTHNIPLHFSVQQNIPSDTKSITYEKLFWKTYFRKNDESHA